MIYLLTILLLLPVVAGAETQPPTAYYSDGMLIACSPGYRWGDNQCHDKPELRIGNSHGDLLLTCDEHYQHCTGPLIEQNACYAKMREAMKAMDQQLTFVFSEDSKTLRASSHSLTLDAVNQWHQTYKECVQP